MALAAILEVVVPAVSSLMSTPSTLMRAVRPKPPPNEIEELPALVGSKLSCQGSR